MRNRAILHCDCNSFFASVELLDHPELISLPVAVSGSIDERKGIILAKNEIAKRFNVKTAESVWLAKQKCPNLILLNPHRNKYIKYSKIINDIYGKYTDLVEPFGIDESWLDITGSWHLFGKSPREVADRIRKDVKIETGLTISIGLSFNKIFAKLGSDYKKPDATTEINYENYKQIVWKLPVADLLYVGKKANKILLDLGIKTIGQLAEADEEMLLQVLGKQGRELARSARGEDYSKVALIGQHEPVKSVGNGMTFKRNLIGYRDTRIGIGALADEVASRLRANKLYATSLQVIIKNPDLKSISRQKPLPYATNTTKDIIDLAMLLIEENWDFSKPIRMLTVTAQNLTELNDIIQTNFLGDEIGADIKQINLEKSIDKIRDKFGKTSVMEAGSLNNSIGIQTRARIVEEDENNNED